MWSSLRLFAAARAPCLPLQHAHLLLPSAASQVGAAASYFFFSITHFHFELYNLWKSQVLYGNEKYLPICIFLYKFAPKTAPNVQN